MFEIQEVIGASLDLFSSEEPATVDKPIVRKIEIENGTNTGENFILHVDWNYNPKKFNAVVAALLLDNNRTLIGLVKDDDCMPGIRSLAKSGGQMDFLEGAYRSVGGKGYICINSARKTKDGTLKSNIVPFIPGGSTVSAPRTMIQSVATEYGIANLSGKTLRERAEAMIAIAHPDFRDELEQYAKEAFH